MSGSTPHVPTFGDDGGVTSQPSSDADCPESTKSVYVFDDTSSLQRFDPTTATFTMIGAVECAGTQGSPNSMAVDRAGTAWVLFTDGSVFEVSTKDASCKPTAFKPRSDRFFTFGMGFATDSADGTSETLYVASTTNATLGTLALDTMTITAVGPLDETMRVELTGTGSGQLFGLVEADPTNSIPWTIAELSKTTGNTLSTKPEQAITGDEGQRSNFAVAAWGGDFYSFVGRSAYRYDTKANTVKEIATTVFRVVGAGVSTCAPHAIVK